MVLRHGFLAWLSRRDALGWLAAVAVLAIGLALGLLWRENRRLEMRLAAAAAGEGAASAALDGPLVGVPLTLLDVVRCGDEPPTVAPVLASRSHWPSTPAPTPASPTTRWCSSTPPTGCASPATACARTTSRSSRSSCLPASRRRGTTATRAQRAAGRRGPGDRQLSVSAWRPPADPAGQLQARRPPASRAPRHPFGGSGRGD